MDGRPVVIGADDFTVSGGYTVNLDRFKGNFSGFAEDLAHEYRIPLLVNVEGVGGGVNIQQSKGYSIIPSSMSFWLRLCTVTRGAGACPPAWAPAPAVTVRV